MIKLLESFTTLAQHTNNCLKKLFRKSYLSQRNLAQVHMLCSGPLMSQKNSASNFLLHIKSTTPIFFICSSRNPFKRQTQYKKTRSGKVLSCSFLLFIPILGPWCVVIFQSQQMLHYYFYHIKLLLFLNEVSDLIKHSQDILYSQAVGKYNVTMSKEESVHQI